MEFAWRLGFACSRGFSLYHFFNGACADVEKTRSAGLSVSPFPRALFGGSHLPDALMNNWDNIGTILLTKTTMNDWDNRSTLIPTMNDWDNRSTLIPSHYFGRACTVRRSKPLPSSAIML